MKWFLGVVAGLVLYEALVKVVELRRRYYRSEDEARLNRARILQQQGDVDWS